VGVSIAPLAQDGHEQIWGLVDVFANGETPSHSSGWLMCGATSQSKKLLSVSVLGICKPVDQQTAWPPETVSALVYFRPNSVHQPSHWSELFIAASPRLKAWATLMWCLSTIAQPRACYD